MRSSGKPASRGGFLHGGAQAGHAGSGVEGDRLQGDGAARGQLLLGVAEAQVALRHAEENVAEEQALADGGLDQFLLGALALGDVAQVGGELHLASDFGGNDGQLDGKLLAASPHSRDLDALAENGAFAGFEVVGQAGVVGVAVRCGNRYLANRVSEHFTLFVAEGGFRCRVEIGDAAALVDGDDAVEGDFQNGGVAHLTLADDVEAAVGGLHAGFGALGLHVGMAFGNTLRLAERGDGDSFQHKTARRRVCRSCS